MAEAGTEGSIEAKISFNVGLASAELTGKIARNWSARGHEVADDAADLSGLTTEEFLRRIDGDERLQDMLLIAVRSAMSASAAEKRSGLARALANGVLADDEAKIDSWALALDCLDKLTAAHLRVLDYLFDLFVDRDQYDLALDCAADLRNLKSAGLGELWTVVGALGLLVGLGLAEVMDMNDHPDENRHTKGDSRCWIATALGAEVISLCAATPTRQSSA